MIPKVNPPISSNDHLNKENYETHKKEYEAQLAREAPPYLAHIELYNKDLTDITEGKEIEKGMCTGSLISTQHVLTYV